MRSSEILLILKSCQKKILLIKMIELDIHKKLQAADGHMQLHVQLVVAKGELVTLYGESGAGKTSTLRLLSGLMQPDDGRIVVGGEVWFDAQKKINLKPQKRKIGYVFQDYALFPNMTVRENLEFALSKNQDHKMVSNLIDIIELGELQNRKPAQLSGGQQQRVALARALVQQPEILLLDEPLSALDYKIRRKLQDYILQVHREFKLTTILISHDIAEITKLSNQVFVMEKGKIVRSVQSTDIISHQELGERIKLKAIVLKIEKQEATCFLTVRIQSNEVRVQVDEKFLEGLEVGDEVLFDFGAFDPVIVKPR